MTSLETIAVTGATGFIGRHLVRRLVQNGSHPHLLARASSRRGGLEDIGDQGTWAEIDLQDPNTVREALLRVKPDVLFHLAGLRGQGHKAEAYAASNVLGTIHVLAAARAAGVRRVILLGSAAEYGRQPGLYSEDALLRPISAYGCSKAAATLFAQAMQKTEGCPVVILRPFTVYGPGQPTDMFVGEAMAHALANRPFAMSEGRHRQDLVYVSDVVEAMLLAAHLPGAEGQIINIGSGHAVSLREIALLIWQFSETTAPLLLGARAAPNENSENASADIRRAQTVLHWQPSVDLIQGLRLTITAARRSEQEIQAK